MHLLQKDPNEVIGKSVFEVSPRKQAQVYFERDRELLKSESSVQEYTSLVISSDSSRHAVTFRKRKAELAGGRHLIVGTIQVDDEEIKTRSVLAIAIGPFVASFLAAVVGVFSLESIAAKLACISLLLLSALYIAALGVWALAVTRRIHITSSSLDVFRRLTGVLGIQKMLSAMAKATRLVGSDSDPVNSPPS